MSVHKRTGGQIIIDALAINRVDRIFSIPGESFLAVLDALHDKPAIKLTTCRQEGGAAYMAEAYGKLTGRPGICLVTRGPGATNASCGLHVAMQDSTPMILLIGQIARKDMDREAFQEIDYRRMFGQVAKWVAQIEDVRRIPEYMNRAFATATSGRPGPVVLALPEDMLTDTTDVPDAKPWKQLSIHPSGKDIDKTVELLSSANRPVIIVGGGGWNESAGRDLQTFVENSAIPVVNSFRCQDYFDNAHPNYIGDLGIGVNPALATRIREADCLLVIGARLGEMTTGGFELIDIPNPRQTFIHVHAGAEELGHIYQPDLAINATSPAFIAALQNRRLSRHDTAANDLSQSREAYENWNKPVHTAGRIQLSDVMKVVKNNTDDDAIICNGAGNNTVWPHRFYQYRKYRSQLAPTSGTMGYGVPAAIAAKLTHPHKTVIAFTGDGDFMMNGQELATAKQYAANVIVILINNGIYGTIRMHQEREYPNRVIGTDMLNPDFCALATAYGMEAESVTTTGQFETAFDRALEAEQPFFIELQTEASILTPTATIESLRALKK